MSTNWISRGGLRLRLKSLGLAADWRSSSWLNLHLSNIANLTSQSLSKYLTPTLIRLPPRWFFPRQCSSLFYPPSFRQPRLPQATGKRPDIGIVASPHALGLGKPACPEARSLPVTSRTSRWATRMPNPAAMVAPHTCAPIRAHGQFLRTSVMVSRRQQFRAEMKHHGAVHAMN